MLNRYIYGAVGAVLLAVTLWGVRVNHLRDHWKTSYTELRDEAGVVLLAVRSASGNPDLDWKDTAQQVAEIDKSLTIWRDTAKSQSVTIDTLGRESARLRKQNAELAAKVAAANARRDAAIARLEQDSLKPGDVADCWAQIRAADDALNTLYREGF
ncbi:hypothetical protein CD928_05645 [Sphingopyxis sp. GW247-27LB]|nr:hypothetical protein CD928_05645 [Sphingopyxis sp. GW247-27LB]